MPSPNSDESMSATYALHCLLLQAILLSWSFEEMDVGGCAGIQCNTSHVSFTCCAGDQPPSHPGCIPVTKSTCSRGECRCVVTVDSNVNCESSSPITIWTESASSLGAATAFNCRHPNFPSPQAVYSLKLRLHDQSVPQDMLLGLSKYNVVSMQLSVHDQTLISMDFFNYFRDLRQLQINYDGSQETAHFSWQLCASLGAVTSLNTLKVSRFSVLCDGDENFRFLSSLQHVSIENAAISVVPHFLTYCAHLRYLKIVDTNVSIIDGLLDLEHLKLLHLPHNDLGSLEGVAFRNRRLEELDLSHNAITSFGEETFKSLKSLLYLDLSNNPIQQLPPHGFLNLYKLRWLYLHHDIDLLMAAASGSGSGSGSDPVAVKRTLQKLSFQHLVGLESLEFISLACNANLHIDDDAFQLMYHLKTLDLKHCNLSRIPSAVGQLCGLQQLWLNFNALTNDHSVPPTIVAKLNHLRRLDLSDNRFTENPNALFLIEPERRSLLLPLIVVLKQQLFWWGDSCSSHMWYLHLVQFGRNSTDTEHYLEMLRYGARKTSFFASNSTGRSKRRCTRAYYQIIHRLMPFRALQRNSFCSRLDRKEQKSRNVNSKNMRLVMNPTTADRVVDPGATVSPVKMHCSVNSTTTMNTTLILKLAEMHHTVDTLAYVLTGCIVLLVITCIGCIFISYRKFFRK